MEHIETNSLLPRKQENMSRCSYDVLENETFCVGIPLYNSIEKQFLLAHLRLSLKMVMWMNMCN